MPPFVMVPGVIFLVMKSPVPYYDDATYSALPVQDRVLLQMASQEGVEEVPKGSNWGPMVKLYLKAAGLRSPAAWCASLVTWCMVNAGVSRTSLPALAASTYYWWAWAQATGKARLNPKRGHLFVWNGKEGGHIGIVTTVRAGGEFDTIEGNSNTTGSREGYKVVRHTRRVEDLKRYPRWCFISLEGWK